MSMSKLKSVLRNCLLYGGMIAFGVVIALILAEIGFRILYPDPKPKLVNQALQQHPSYGIAFIPEAEGWNTSLRGEYRTYVKINERGLRGKAYDYHKDDEVRRILILGDSFTAALQVAEAQTFSQLLAERLNQSAASVRFEVINAGVVGHGTSNELDYYIHEGHKYQADLVLLAFFSGNDIVDNVNPPHYQIKDGQLIPLQSINYREISPPPWARPGTGFRQLRNFLYQNSRLYSVVLELGLHTLFAYQPQLAEYVSSLGLAEATRPVLNMGNVRRPAEEAWQMTEALILAMAERVSATGAQFFVVILPDESEVDLKKWEALLARYPDLFDPQILNTSPSDRLGQFLQANAIPFVQLKPALKTHLEQGNALYFPVDGHWTPQGHEIATQVIFEALQAQLELAGH